jgi:hypothetical protein
MYPFMTLDDGTEIVHSEILADATREKVKVYFEKPILNGFQSAECFLPNYEWRNVNGFTDAEIMKCNSYLETVAHIVIQLAREGGFEHAANF